MLGYLSSLTSGLKTCTGYRLGVNIKVKWQENLFFHVLYILDSLLCAENKKYFWRIFNVKREGLGST